MPNTIPRPYRAVSRSIVVLDDLDVYDDLEEKPVPTRHYLSLAAAVLCGLVGIACPCYWPHCWASGVGLVAGLSGAFWFFAVANAAVEEL